MAANTSFAPGYAYSATPVPQYGSNLLTPAASSFEDGSLGGWANYVNATPTNSTAQAYSGTHSLQVAAIAAGDASVYSAGVLALPNNNPTTVNGIVVSFQCKANTISRPCYAALNWIDRTLGAAIPPQLTGSPAVSDNTSGWTFYYFNFPTYVGTYAVQLIIVVGGPAAGEIHWIDNISVNAGVYYPT